MYAMPTNLTNRSITIIPNKIIQNTKQQQEMELSTS